MISVDGKTGSQGSDLLQQVLFIRTITERTGPADGEGCFPMKVFAQQLNRFLAEQVKQEILAIASRLRLLEVGEMGTLRLALVAGDNPFTA